VLGKGPAEADPARLAGARIVYHLRHVDVVDAAQPAVGMDVRGHVAARSKLDGPEVERERRRKGAPERMRGVLGRQSFASSL
jgi:hypothetical protein